MAQLPAIPGTYALILCSETGQRIAVGRLGTMEVRPGWYMYIGSAFGPGGLAGRMRHHLAPAPKVHWHIDYLRRAAPIESIWYTTGVDQREHEWAGIFAAWPGATIALPGFGASDCRCPAHLFHLAAAPCLADFQRRAAVQGAVVVAIRVIHSAEE